MIANQKMACLVHVSTGTTVRPISIYVNQEKNKIKEMSRSA